MHNISIITICAIGREQTTREFWLSNSKKEKRENKISEPRKKKKMAELTAQPDERTAFQQ